MSQRRTAATENVLSPHLTGALIDASSTALSESQVFLIAEFKRASENHHERSGDFDMDDGPELARADFAPRLKEALVCLQSSVFPAWQVADSSALRHQHWHRVLARITIFTGTTAIILAILQMTKAFSFTLPLEIVAVVAGTLAVGVGLWTKGDRKWLCERNRAERLRMLKFRALGWQELWCADHNAWKQRLDSEVARLASPVSETDLLEWSAVEHIGNEPSSCAITSTDGAALADLEFYYRIKRLDFQANYFEKRSRQYHAAARPWRHLSLPVFMISTGCVLIHFIAHWLLAGEKLQSQQAALWEQVEVWSLVFAAILPVAGLGIRVWLGAFEPHRSANLFACKHRTVSDLSKRSANTKNDPHLWTGYVGEAELFFENEHREWLRLMLETEWML